MTRIILACIALAMPQFAASAPCDILPYANQCQGSNLWPIPSGWAADNNGDCQPQPPQYDYVDFLDPIASNQTVPAWRWEGTILGIVANPAWCATYRSPPGNPSSFRWVEGPTASGFSAIQCGNLNPWWNAFICPTGTFGTNSSDPTEARYHVNLLTGAGWRPCFRHAIRCPAGYSMTASGNANTVEPRLGTQYSCVAQTGSQFMKPSDGVCASRWTSSAQTALQKDPLDPDCDANSCVFDGTCKLR